MIKNDSIRLEFQSRRVQNDDGAFLQVGVCGTLVDLEMMTVHFTGRSMRTFRSLTLLDLLSSFQRIFQTWIREAVEVERNKSKFEKVREGRRDGRRATTDS
jgi:hypothetical protein